MSNECNDLLPCPFCGNTDISSGEVLVELPGGAGLAKQAMCSQCGALGPEAKVTERQARGPEGDAAADAAWNRRAAPAGLTDDDLNELAYSACAEAMSFGLSHETFLRYFKGLRNRAAEIGRTQEAA